MNTGSTPDPGAAPDFDARLRAVHAQAVAATPARVRLQLRPRSADPGLRRGWSLAAAFAMGLVALGVLWQRPTPDARAPDAPRTAATAASDVDTAVDEVLGDGMADAGDAYAALDESPEFYLWLASSDASAMLDSRFPGRDAFDGDAVME